jgi:hypothetical protein
MKTTLYIIGFLLIFANVSRAQNDVSKPIIRYPVYFDVSPPLRDMAKNAMPHADNSWKDGIVKNFFNMRQHQNKPVFAPDWVDPVRQSSAPAAILDTTIANFEGNSNTQGYDPPDTHGDVGPNHFFQVVNCHYSIYSKTGALLLGPLNTSTIWNGMPNNSNDGDAVVLYDEIANRWMIAQFSLANCPTGPYYEMIAVSQTADPTGSWYRYEYSFTAMPDYPKFGIWPDGYYMSVNLFAGCANYTGTGQAAFHRSKMLTGDATAEMVYFTLPSSNNAWALLPSDCDGVFPTTGTPNYFVYLMNGPYYLGIYEFHVDWTTMTNSTFGNYQQLTVNTFNDNLPGIPQKNTTRLADALSDRLMYRLQYRKFSDHAALVTNHTVNAGSNVGGVRWYELRKTTGSWSVYQQSTFSPDATSRWMGSIALDTAGNMALGYSISSSSMFPSIKYTGRMKNDPLNTMSIAERGIFNGTGSNTVNDNYGTCRWGDYSALTADPAGNATFWYTQQYNVTMGSSWHTRIASFSFQNSMTVTATATPPLINIGQTSQLNVTASGGTGIYTYSWTSIPAGFNTTTQNPVVAPVNTTKYVAHVTSGTQTKTDTTQVSVNINVTATANPYTINAGQTSQLTTTAAGGTGTYTYSWSSSPAGFTSTMQNPVVSPGVTTIYTDVVSDGALSNSDTAIVHVNQQPMTVTATATPPLICLGSTSQLNAIATGGSLIYTYSWTSNPPGFTSNIQNPVVQPVMTTRYIVSVNDGSQTKMDSVLVSVTPTPTAFAGNDTTVCVTLLSIDLNGTATSYSTVAWSTSGSGTFSNSTQLNTSYYPSAADKTTGTVNLTLTAWPVSPCVNSVSSTRHITFTPCAGIPETSSDLFGFTLAPNPSPGIFTLQVNGARNKELSITIFDAWSKPVYTDKFRNTSKSYQRQFDFSKLAKGIYLVKVQTEQEVKSEKLVIQ